MGLSDTFLANIEIKRYYNAPNLSLAIACYGMQRIEYCILVECVNVLVISNCLLHSAHERVKSEKRESHTPSQYTTCPLLGTRTTM